MDLTGFLFSFILLLIIPPGTSFAWHDNDGYRESFWVYPGSGRDQPYSYYIDEYYNPGYADYLTFQPEYIDAATFVKQPIQTQTANAAQPEVFTVNIPNHNGGYTVVMIKKSGTGYTGPQGEYYPEFPKIFQLEIMYGK